MLRCAMHRTNEIWKQRWACTKHTTSTHLVLLFVFEAGFGDGEPCPPCLVALTTERQHVQGAAQLLLDAVLHGHQPEAHDNVL